MIKAMIFDLDGTLVQTEKLKALSYARAAVELCPVEISEEQVVEAFKDVVGLSRREVAAQLVSRFGLEETARARMGEFGVHTPWQAFVQVRLLHYQKMIADPEVLQKNRWPHNMALLEEARRTNCKVGLATMSHCDQVRRVLEILALKDAFGFVATRDDVERGKPDPEIYLLVAGELGVSPPDCLVIEDSPSGVQAAVSAGMWCIAVGTPFTSERLHQSGILDERWIVDEPDRLPDVVQQMYEERLED
jgi:HAD superfamily hydrolase (TIGR01509 family)